MSYLLSFFSPAVLFNFRPSPVELAPALTLVVGGIALIGLGIALLVVAKGSTRDGLFRNGLRRMSQPGIAMGSILILYAAIAYQGLPILAAKLWLLLWGIILAAWAIIELRYHFITAPKRRADRRQQEEFRRYLPK